jgi:hypothetical protein
MLNYTYQTSTRELSEKFPSPLLILANTASFLILSIQKPENHNLENVNAERGKPASSYVPERD